MSSIGSGKTPAQQVADLIFQSIASDAAANAGPSDPTTGEKQAKSAPKKPGPANTKAALNAKADPAAGAQDPAAAKPGAPSAAEVAAPPAAGAPSDESKAAAPGAPAVQAGASDGVDAQGPSVVRGLVGPSSTSSTLPTAEQVARDAGKSLKQLDDVSGLASDTNATLGQQKALGALNVLTSTKQPSDAAFKKAVTDFADGLETMGQGEKTSGMLQQIFGATAQTPAQLAHKQALAAQAGVDVPNEDGSVPTTTANISAAAAPNDTQAVADAKAQLQAHIDAGKTDAATINADTKKLQQAMNAAGQGDQVGTTLANIAQQAGSGSQGSASVLAAAAKLGVQMPGTMDEANDKGKTAVAAAQAARANQKAAAEKAAASAGGGGGGSGGGAGKSNATPSGSAATSMVGSTGDITGLAARSGAVKGDFKMGVLPDYDNGATGGTAGFVSRTGVRPAKISGYVNASADGSFDSGAADRWIKDAVDNNVPNIELSISSYGTGPLSDAQVAGIKAAVDKARAAGKEIDIRFGYEMNYGGGGAEQGGRVTNNNNTSAFKQQWAQVAAVVNPDRNSTPPAKMVWSPNVWSGGDLPYADWLPDDPSTIDSVALDYYHKAGDDISVDSLSKVMDPVYAIAQKLNVPFTFGETGVTGGDNNGPEKTKWLDLLASPELREKYPLYQGFDWFDYVKGGTNFSLSQDSSASNAFRDWYGDTFKSGDSDSSPQSDTTTTTNTTAS